MRRCLIIKTTHSHLGQCPVLNCRSSSTTGGLVVIMLLWREARRHTHRGFGIQPAASSQLPWLSVSNLEVCACAWARAYLCLCTCWFVSKEMRQIKSLYLSHDWMRSCFVAARGFGRCLCLCVCTLCVCLCEEETDSSCNWVIVVASVFSHCDVLMPLLASSALCWIYFSQRRRFGDTESFPPAVE